MDASDAGPLILASASPRRRALLGALGLGYDVTAADIDETVAPHEAPGAAAERLALAKARAVAAAAHAAAADAAGLVVGADTIVVAPAGTGEGGHGGGNHGGGGGGDGRGTVHTDVKPTILGKPRDAAEAVAMLRRLRGRRHDVVTGVAVVDIASGRAAAASETTAVWMRRYDNAEIDVYVAGGDPFDKAGGYAIQHAGFHPVAALVGSEANVIGLPLGLLRALLRRVAGRSAPIDAPVNAQVGGRDDGAVSRPR